MEAAGGGGEADAAVFEVLPCELAPTEEDRRALLRMSSYAFNLLSSSKVSQHDEPRLGQPILQLAANGPPPQSFGATLTEAAGSEEKRDEKLLPSPTPQNE
ncbi:hypothetical protein Q4I28_000931 [Leishmania naiffi]|uniref:Uncharacterized protein n=1 Tax=Leishmania naiffi TaxID=5678 RepID=A0AAW3C725_9TRYP